MSARRRLRLTGVLLAGLAAGPAFAARPVPPRLPGARIGEIRLERTNVFDPSVPGEDWLPFRLANKLHIPTREHVIRRELLFIPGDSWDPFKVLESERNLRANGSFRRADILPIKRSDGLVDAVVRTQDSWTTNPRFSAGTEGGESFFSLGLEEGNILGYGKSAAFDLSRNNGKTSSAYSYGDPRFLGSRLGLGGAYSRNSSGDTGAASLSRPYYSLDTPNALAMAWNRSVDDKNLYQDADLFSTFLERRRVAEASAGTRLKSDQLFVQRVEAGWYADRAQFEPGLKTAAGTLPPDRELSGPTAGYSWVQARYIKEDYIDRMERVEDFNLGNEFSVRGGWMGAKTGSDRDRVIFNVVDQQGISFAPGRFAIARVAFTGRALNGSVENGLATVNLNGFWKTNWRGDHTLVGHLEGATGRYLDREGYVALGGNTGLRGYKNNSFIGGKAILLNVEDRFFFSGEWFHLVRLGAALFVDSGVVAPEGSSLTLRGVKSDVGAGLRLASTRSRSGGVARVDIAYALNGGPGGSRWILSIKGGQAFNLFSSASSRVDQSPPSRLN
ncbi:MAG: hypothetical protein HYZ74_05610 [Elusimicrobia bacterium]|nr:hypothetical protein [Elusimicrobiota bacterium]